MLSVYIFTDFTYSSWIDPLIIMQVLFLVSSSQTTIFQMLLYLMFSQKSETVLISFHSFFPFCSTTLIFTIESSSSLTHSSASVILLLILSRVKNTFNILFLVFYILLFYFFQSFYFLSLFALFSSLSLC